MTMWVDTYHQSPVEEGRLESSVEEGWCWSELRDRDIQLHHPLRSKGSDSSSWTLVADEKQRKWEQRSQDAAGKNQESIKDAPRSEAATTVKKMENTHALVAKQRMGLKSRLGVDWFADQTDATLGESKCGNKNSRFSILDRRRRRFESRVWQSRLHENAASKRKS